MPTEFKYLVLIFFLFVLPPALSRLRIPGGITAFLLGGFSAYFLGWYEGDNTLPLLAKFGIMALFLLAGLEVDLAALRKKAGLILGLLAVKLATMAALVWALQAYLGLATPVAWLTALVLLTPSTGFIIEALETAPMGAAEKDWTRSIAIAVELLALLVLFVALRSGSTREFLVSSAAFAGLFVALPLILHGYARFIAPYAPNAEFAFLIMVALLTGTLTRALGTYYLVGAFMVGLVAQRFRASLPSLSSERLLYALKLFAFFFMPFYFFHAGRVFAQVQPSWTGLALGLVFFVLLVPLRLLITWAQLQWVLGQDLAKHRDVAVALLPTLVFGIVVSGILLETFQIEGSLYFGLVVYTLGVSLLPALLLKTRLSDGTGLEMPAPPQADGTLGYWMDPHSVAKPKGGPKE